MAAEDIHSVFCTLCTLLPKNICMYNYIYIHITYCNIDSILNFSDKHWRIIDLMDGETLRLTPTLGGCNVSSSIQLDI